MDVSEEKKLEALGAFEISRKMLALAQKNEKSNIFLNAGRGNPNWIQTQARLAFVRLIQFGVQESKETINNGIMAGYIEKDGIRERLFAFLDPDNNEEDKFLIDAVNYCQDKLGLNRDDVVAEWVNGAIANNYPVPDRCLVNTEKIIKLLTIIYKNYLMKVRIWQMRLIYSQPKVVLQLLFMPFIH